MKNLLIIFTFSAFIFCAYNEGETISITDQQLSKEVCYASDFESDYNVGDNVSLYDFNGDANGGEYHVFFIDMSATW